MKTIWVRDGNTLKPASEEAEAYLKKIGQGEEVAADISRPRNLRFHKKFMKLCSVIAENSSTPYTPRAIAAVLEIRTGHFTPVMTKGELLKVPDSISFAAMDDVEFGKLFDDCIRFVCEEIIPGMEESDLKREIEEFIK